jgi:hypothetical protein
VPSLSQQGISQQDGGGAAAVLVVPAFVVSVAYVDPGNFATNMSGGASYGFTLLWVIVAANLVAMFVQALASPPWCRPACSSSRRTGAAGSRPSLPACSP